MRIIVTGASGYVGRRLVAELADHHVMALDVAATGIPELPHVIPIAGDLCDPAVLESATAGGCDAVVHLATIPSGGAEKDPELAWRVNVDATKALSLAAARNGKQPTFVFSSSIAVYGDPLPPSIDDATPLMPKLYYGVHKAMMERWLAGLTRRGMLDAISLRLPGVVARPRAPSGMTSAFLSDVFHALHAGEPFVMPVSPDATHWLVSLDCTVRNLVHVLEADLGDAPGERALTLPSLCVRSGDLVAEIARQTGNPAESVSWSPEPAVQAAFGAQPPLTTVSADGLGFVHDGNLRTLVNRALAALSR